VLQLYSSLRKRLLKVGETSPLATACGTARGVKTAVQQRAAVPQACATSLSLASLAAAAAAQQLNVAAYAGQPCHVLCVNCLHQLSSELLVRHCLPRSDCPKQDA
jgi:hypothetical protein